MTKPLKPLLRFNSYNEDWEQRKLGDVVPITMGQSPDGSTYSDTPSDYILVQGNADLQNGWVTPRIWTSQVTKKADGGDLIMSVRAPAGAMGKTAYNVVIGRGVAAIKGNEFIYQLLVKMNSNGYWKVLSCGSTFESLNSDNIKNADVLIPDVAEQEKIGEYFVNLDRLITLHQRKLDTLKVVKKSMLEKMFPREGCKVPEVRFSGFTEDWEQRKLVDIATFINGRAYSQDELLNEGKYKVLRVGNFYTNDSWYYSDLELNDKYYVDKGDLLYTWSATFGPHIWLGERVIYHYHIWKIQPKNDLDKHFAVHLLNNDKDKITSDKNGSTMVHITKIGMENKDVTLPNIDEQKKLAQMFDNLNNLITLHQRELELLQNVKKSLLEKMFV